MNEHVPLTRRSALLLAAAGAAAVGTGPVRAAQPQVITVHKDPNCGCCTEWVRHLQAAGFTTRVVDTADLTAVKARLQVPAELAACHTAEIAGYIVEGHVPAVALERFLAERPAARGLAVAGMPVGSPGMEGGTPEPYDVVMFGPGGWRTYMRFIGSEPA